VSGALDVQLEGPAPEVMVSNDLVRRGVIASPVLIAVCAVIWGGDGAWSCAYAIGIVLANFALAAGSMAPKVAAAVEFAKLTGGEAVIGALGDLPDLIDGVGGTRLSERYDGITYR